MGEDIRVRLGESIVRLQVAQMIKGLDKEVRDLVLNPNEDDLAEECMGNLLKVYNHVTSELKQGADRIYAKLTTKGDAKILDPSKMILPENRSHLECIDNTNNL